MPATVTPLVYAILCSSSPVVMGTDVDQPRNLSKSVTVRINLQLFPLLRSRLIRSGQAGFHRCDPRAACLPRCNDSSAITLFAAVIL
jgi:hypothetical protein